MLTLALPHGTAEANANANRYAAITGDRNVHHASIFSNIRVKKKNWYIFPPVPNRITIKIIYQLLYDKQK